MGRLTDILNAHVNETDFNDRWDATNATNDFGIVPSGEYICHITRGELGSSRKNGTPKYVIEFAIVEGEHQGRRFWLDCWLTDAALPHSKRDLIKIGISTPALMERPLPRWIRCKVHVVVRRDDDGTERNRVRNFDVICITPTESDPFAPLNVDSVQLNRTGIATSISDTI